MPRKSRSSAKRSLSPTATRLLAGVVTAGVLGAGYAVWYLDPERRAGVAFVQARAAIDTGNTRTAFKHLEQALRFNPNHGAARFELARVFISAGDGASAEKQLAAATELGFEHPEFEVLKIEALLLQRQFREAAEQAATGTGGADEKRLAILGQANLASGDVDEAFAAFSRLLDKKPDSATAKRGMAWVAIAEGQIDEADRQLESAAAADPVDVQTWILKGELELATQRYEAAEASFAKALEVEPERDSALVGHGRALLALGHADRAAVVVETLLSTHPGHPMGTFLRAGIEERKGNTENAKRLLLEMLQRQPGHTPSQLLLGDLNYRAGEYSQAEERLTRYLSAGTNQQRARRLLAATYLALDEPGKALATLRALPDDERNDPRSLHLLATAHERLGQDQESRRYLSAAARAEEERTETSSERARTRLAMASLREGKPDAAISALRVLLEDDPDNADARALLAFALLKANRADAALVVAEELVSRHPDTAQTRNVLGGILQAMKRFGEARDAFERAIELDPGFSTAGVNLAKLHEVEGDVDASIAAYRAVLERTPDHVPALVGLASALAATERATESIAHLERAREVDPRAVTPRLVLANYAVRIGNLPRALKLLEEAHAHAPNDPRVLMASARVHSRTGRNDVAIELLTRLNDEVAPSAEALFDLAIALERSGDRPGAKARLRQAIERGPGLLAARVRLGRIALEEGRPDAAAEIARKLIAREPKFAPSHVLLGDALNHSGRGAAGAVDAFEAAYVLDPDPDTLSKLADALVIAGRGAEAVARLRARLDDEAADAQARLVLASVLSRTGAHREALLEYERALFDRPDDVFVLNNLAWLYFERGDRRALDMAAKAHRLAPDDVDVLDTYGWLLANAGQAKQGLALLDSAMEAAPNTPGLRLHRAVAMAAAGDRARARQELRAIATSGRSVEERKQARAALDKFR